MALPLKAFLGMSNWEVSTSGRPRTVGIANLIWPRNAKGHARKTGLSGALPLPYPNGIHHPSFYQVTGEYSNVTQPISQKGFKVILFSEGNRYDYRVILL